MSDTSEIRAAADRRREWLRDDCAGDYPRHTRDACALADAYLAAHRDDAEPLTEEWLRSVGFTDYLEADKWCSSYLSLWIEPQQHNTYFLAVHWARPDHPQGPYWSANGFTLYKPAHPKTRGDVRRICAALGRPLVG